MHLRESLLPKEVLQFQEVLSGGRRESRVLPVIQIIVREARVEGCERVELVAEKRINIERSAE